MALVNHVSGSMFDETNLVAYYKLEDVNDSGPSGLTLTNNGTTTFVTGKYTNCANFVRASSQYLTVASNLGIAGGTCTFSVWFSPLIAPAANTYHTIFTQYEASTKTEFSVYYRDNSGTKQIWIARTRCGVVSAGPDVAYTMAIGSWYHICLVYDSVNIAGYVNSVLLAAPEAASGVGTGTIANAFSLSYNIAAVANYCDGKVDEVLVFTRAWTAQEVYNYYQQYKRTLSMGSNY